jgi:exopolysaccharide biosynthesis predicted pyruvyltransferase EpsI
MNAPAQHPDRELIARLSGRLDGILADAIPSGARVALLDVPTHMNVGDHAITLGELTALRRGGYDIAHISAASDAPVDRIADRLDDAVVLLHGGGNLGDFWPEHQRYREAVLRAFPDRPVVQLPQSLWFEDSATLETAKRAFDGHPNFTLLIRDEEGLEFAQRHFTCRVRLCPDSALALGPLARPSAPSQEVVCLARYDHERTAEQDEAAPSIVSVDWPRTLDRWEYMLRDFALAGTRRFVKGGGRTLPLERALVQGAYERLARRRVDHGLRLLSAGERVVTDRLHAHLLSLLLGIPHVVADTRSGKVHDYIETWTASSSLVRRVPSLIEGLEEARSVV